jgi:hypothetical protein
MLPLYEFTADLTFIIAFVCVYGFHQSTVLEVKKLGALTEEEIVGISNDSNSTIDFVSE